MSELDVRKYINILTEASLKEHNFSSEVPTEATGPTTHIEINMLDGEQAELEVYTNTGDELKRVLDLAGVFHKEKQGMGMGMGAGPVAPGLPGVPPIGGAEPTLPGAVPGPTGAPPMGAEPPMAPGSDMGIDPTGMPPEAPMDAMSDIPPSGGPDIPSGSDLGVDSMGDEPMGMDPMGADPMGNDIDDIDGPEMSFDMGDDDEPEEGMFEQGKRFDYGHPNPLQGRENYGRGISGLEGGATKSVRYVPANSGDNPLTGKSKSLLSYMEEIEGFKKKLAESDPNKERNVDVVAAKFTTGNTLNPAQKKKIQDKAKDLKTQPSMRQMKPDEIAAALSPDDAVPAQLKKIDDLKKEIDIDQKQNPNDDLAEKRRRYSFSMSALPTYGLSSADRRRKSALKAGKKGLKRGFHR